MATGKCSRCLDIALQQTCDCHLRDGLGAGGLIPLDLVDADIVLAVSCGCESRHCLVVLKIQVVKIGRKAS